MLISRGGFKMCGLYRNRYRIESNRLIGWDYSAFGHYYITMVTSDRMNYFGKITNGEMILNDIGLIVKDEFLRSFEIRNEFRLGVYVIMPNHIHAIISSKKDKIKNDDQQEILFCRKPKSISSFIANFKSSTINAVDDWIDETGIDIPKFNKYNPLWQSNYYDHIIRNEKEFDNISAYIINNPKKWKNNHNHDVDFL